MIRTFTLNNLSQTQDLSSKIARVLTPNFKISLVGNLGAGKSTLVRGILRALGITGLIKSPSFSLVEPYLIDNFSIYHFDLYRLNSVLEWYDAGFDEYFCSNNLSFIEWADKIKETLPQMDWQITIAMKDEQRILSIKGISSKGDECLNQLIINGVSL